MVILVRIIRKIYFFGILIHIVQRNIPSDHTTGIAVRSLCHSGTGNTLSSIIFRVGEFAVYCVHLDFVVHSPALISLILITQLRLISRHVIPAAGRGFHKITAAKCTHRYQSGTGDLHNRICSGQNIIQSLARLHQITKTDGNRPHLTVISSPCIQRLIHTGFCHADTGFRLRYMRRIIFGILPRSAQGVFKLVSLIPIDQKGSLRVLDLHGIFHFDHAILLQNDAV